MTRSEVDRTTVVTAHRATRLVRTLAVAALAAAVASPAAAAPPGSSTAEESMKLCVQADDLAGEARAQALARSMALAESVLARDERDALAHFTVACSLGKQMQDAGIGIGQLVRLHRLKHEFDATLALAPGDADALMAKGALLLRLPRLLGGDTEEAEQLLRRAVAAEPDNDQARCYLAEALTARGAAAEAQALNPHC
jgi:Flp pilus assembly protein TadD